MKLLVLEQQATAHLAYESNVHTETLNEIEAMAESRARKRELTLTKLFARLNGNIRSEVTQNEGNLKTLSRKRTPYGAKSHEMLFDGIRDQKLKANWVKTPQPIVIKLMTARCLRDKIPKGDYVLRAGVLDRLVENKLYYKFVEYGNRVKEQRHVDGEKQKQEDQEKALHQLSNLNDNEFEAADNEAER